MKKVAPKNPHFLKPILPGFKNGVDIPIAFLTKYLNGQAPKFAILRRGDRRWPVKISGGRKLAGGWEKFAADNGLHIGDFVFFKYEGDSLFDVSVCDSTLCERESPLPHGGCSPVQGTTSTRSSDDHLHFTSTIQPYCIRKPYLYFPAAFVKSHFLGEVEEREMILRDEKERSWPVVVGKMSNRFGFKQGWLEFRTANGLKEGDPYKFELIKTGEKLIAKFHCNFQATSAMSGDHPHFTSTIKPYCISRQHLNLPAAFAKSHVLGGVEEREMILRDEKERSWPMVVGRMGTHFSLKRGWVEFRMANGLKEGDRYKFELIESGEKAIAKFHCHYSGDDH